MDGDALVLQQGDHVERLKIPDVDTAALDTDAFVREVLDGAEPILSPTEALRSLEVGDAAARAAETGRRVVLG